MKRNNKIRVGIIGCGNIFPRHVEAILANRDYFALVAICDIDKKKLALQSSKYSVVAFQNHEDMFSTMKKQIDMISICTPNNLHYQQALDALRSGYDILIEKPIDFKSIKVMKIVQEAKRFNKKAYAVLQVRYNPSILITKEALLKKILGTIRSISLIQRWQRPASYFHTWRSDVKIGGRILYEVGIHYLDILQWLFGVPHILSTRTFKNKHKQIQFEDTLFSIVQYPNGASGSIEVTIAAEPTNLECSISIIGSKGYIKIGGVALNTIEKTDFTDASSYKLWSTISNKYTTSLAPNSYGTHLGSCPNHPELYRNIAMGRGILLGESINSIKFIESIYKKEI